ncbi:SacI domain-containing protein [Patellaria atrata CBS 101060]|uniref:SacI domain-containing protein n=1 Tax=Patellaria atrata CBS 101060 TaxID=1346257 RepID=A0A9P4SIY4_9PEZI|nr:SacI domain-containing protein [Patellaria atrata CBS 101060]
MPGIVRKLLIFAAVDGLILQPAPPRNHPPSTQQAIKLDYKIGSISPLLKDRREELTAPVSLETFGIVGVLKVASSSFLISISGRDQVAQIRGKPIYVIRDVAVIPLSSRDDADKAITQAKENIKRSVRSDGYVEASDNETSDDDDSLSLTENESGELEKSKTVKHERSSSVAEDVIGKKGVYGRFAKKWFSKKGWSAEGRRMQGMSSQGDKELPQQPQGIQTNPDEEKKDSKVTESLTESVISEDGADNDAENIPPQDIPKALAGNTDENTIALLPKVLRTTKIYFGSKSFFFSYDYDISRSLSRQSASSSLPLFKAFDPLFFWNHHIQKPFIESGQHNFVLPLLQGFVGQRAFTVDVPPDSTQSAIIGTASKQEDINAEHNDPSHNPQLTDSDPTRKDFLLTLISRRSIHRAGLRYLRRGVDEDGNAANNVETEQILTCVSEDASAAPSYSFVQVRGSIPLYFSQSPYSLKPVPLLYGSEATNTVAFKKHFVNLSSRYGKIYVASLVDKHGTESKVGKAYEKHADMLNESCGTDGKGENLGFEWFDFHNVCRGMKFEKVSVLLATLAPSLESFGWSIHNGEKLISTQNGVLRTNCMDCLDRTNVVQAACARNILEKQLADQGVAIDLEKDPSTSWFNTLWADNGDAISRQYAGTAALKGDFTRTRQRNISGALTDFGLTLSRYYNNIVNDYFTQAVIDYILGRAADSIFAEFEADMKSHDYAIDLRKVRQAAIDRCAEIVIEDQQEDLLTGWTLSCPAKANSLRSFPFEECVLLLTNAALYFCRFDWNTEKPKEFERVELDRIKAINKGVYITSTLAQRHMDESKNVGFVLVFAPVGKELVRVNTRSLGNEKSDDEALPAPKSGEKKEETRLLAFKALPPNSGVTTAENEESTVMSETDMINHICEEIQRVVNRSLVGEAVTGRAETERSIKVEEKDIISVADAKKSTGYMEQLGYSLKKLVWG